MVADLAIKPLLDGLEKLITEHASAAVMKDRIELLKERYSDLEDRLKKATAAKDELEGFNAALRTEIEDLRAENEAIRRLKEDADRQRQQELTGGDRLPADREAVLLAVRAAPNRRAAEIASALGVSADRVEWHLDALLAGKLLDDDYATVTPWGGGHTWRLSSHGRNYLARYGLI